MVVNTEKAETFFWRIAGSEALSTMLVLAALAAVGVAVAGLPGVNEGMKLLVTLTLVTVFSCYVTIMMVSKNIALSKRILEEIKQTK